MSKSITPANPPPQELAQLRTELALSRQECAAARAALADERDARSRMDIVLLAARRLVAGPDSTAYTVLAAAIDAYDRKTEGSGS